MKTDAETDEQGKRLARRDFIRTASLSMFAVTAIAAGAAESKAEAEEYEWNHVTTGVRPKGWSADLPAPGEFKSYTVNTDNFAEYGYPHDSIFIARVARTDERPPKGSIVLAWVKGGDKDKGGRYMVRFVGTRRDPDACFKEVVTLEDGRTRKDFCSCQVEFEAIGEAAKRVKGGTPEDLAAHRIAAMVEDPKTPRVIRDLLRHVCTTVDCFSAERINADTMDFKLDDGDAVTPELIRREVPAMLRKVGRWKLEHWMPHELKAPGKKGRR
jgi:hypothetical protein